MLDRDGAAFLCTGTMVRSRDHKGARDEALRKCVQGWIQIAGPMTARQFARDLSLDASSVYQQFVASESQGLLMRGTFERAPAVDEADIEWCERRILQRIHKLTIGTRRKQVDTGLTRRVHAMVAGVAASRASDSGFR